MNNKLVLLDGSSMAFRAFYGLRELDKFRNSKGLHTNALYAFHNMLKGVLEREQPTHVLVAFDAGKTTFRTELYTEYKDGRDSMPSELAEQWPYFPTMIEAFHIAHYQLPQYEADDIIGTLARQASEAGFDVVVVSGDRDLTQLASDTVRVDITGRGTQVTPYTPETIAEEQGIEPHQIIDVKGLMGDSSDNYPGVRGVGEKTALKLIQQYGSVEGVYEAINQFKPSKLKENLIADQENALLSKRLATIDQQAPLGVSLEDTRYVPQDTDQLRAFYEEMNFKQFLAQLSNGTPDSEAAVAQVPEVAYQEVRTIDDHLFAQASYVHIELLADNYHEGTPLWVGWGSEHHWYVADAATVFAAPAFQRWAADDTKPKKVFDAKRQRVIAARNGVVLNGIQFDALLAAYIVDVQDNSSDMATVLKAYDHGQLPSDELIYGKGAKRSIPEDAHITRQHVAAKLACLQRVIPALQQALHDNAQEALYYDMELPLATVLADMECAGIRVSADTLEQMGASFTEQLAAIEQEIYDQVGETFNLNSPKQLGVVLFEKLQLPVLKKTKTGYSTAADVLEKLQWQSPVVADILRYRQLAKLNATYVTGLLATIQEDGKIHTRYVQTLTQTGRLSSTDPNLQNIPIRMEEGRRIRQAFVPDSKDSVLLSVDYSQIELRVLAHIAKDPFLKEAFLQGRDIHTSTAMRVFGVPEEAVDDRLRRQAKAVNFGIVYGISDYGLSQNLNITRKAAQAFIDTYFEKYPGIQQYMKESVAFAKEHGYVTTLFHRRRYVPDIHSSNFNIRSFAERTAINTPIQGTAADIIKVAMIQVAERLKQAQLKTKMLLQVHDELIFDVPRDELAQAQKLICDTMEQAVKLDVPLTVACEHGNNWYEAK